MKFIQFDNKHIAQAWERMKSMIKNFPTHGLTTWMIIQTFYAGLNFYSRNLLDSAARGTFMSITLRAATKLFDNMMVNYSEWHTERAPQGKNVNSVEETSSLSDNINTIMAILANDRAHVDPNNVPLACLVAQEEHVDVNFIKNNNFNNSAYRNNFVATIIGHFLLPMVMVMETPMVTPPTTLGARPLSLKSCSRTSSVNKLLLISLLRKSWVKLMFLLLKLIALHLMLNF
jgi:hypothetical protein